MLDIVRRLLAPSRARASAVTRIEVDAVRGSDAVWTPVRFDKLAKEGYEQAAWVYACVNVQTRQTRYLEPLLYQRTPDGDEEIDDHPLLDLLRRPNDEMSLGAFAEAVMGYALLSGNSYIERVGLENRPPVELWPKRPDRMMVLPDRENRVRGYRYEVDGQKYDFDRWQVRHLKAWHPLDDWYGLSPLSAAARGVDIFNAGQAHNLALMQNGARPTGAWVTEGVLAENAWQKLRAEIEEARQPNRRGGTLIVEGGLRWQELGLSPRDLDFLAGQVDAARQVHAAYGVHPVLTGLETGTYENQEQALRSLLSTVVFPWLDFLFAELTVWLAPAYGDNLRVDYDRDAFPALQEDQGALWDRALDGFSKLIITRNEAREMLGYGTLDGPVGDVFADQLRMSVSLPTAAGEGAASAPPAGQQGGTAAGEAGEGQEPITAAQRPVQRARASFGVDRSDPVAEAMFWRSRVTEQLRWEAHVQREVAALFDAERARIMARAEAVGSDGDANALLVAALGSIRESEWRELLTSLLVAVAVESGRGTLDTLPVRQATDPRALVAAARRQKMDVGGIWSVFGLVSDVVLGYLSRQSSEAVVAITDTTRRMLREALAAGSAVNEGFADLARRIDRLYLEQIIPHRSEVIARTEVIRASNYGSQQAAVATGLNLEKRWLATMDDRVRPEHSAAHGQAVPLTSAYEVGGERLMYPGDPAGSAENTIQCRCTETYQEVRDG